MMKWVFDAGFKWETPYISAEDVFSQIAYHDVELLEWAHERGCRFDGKALVNAACCGDKLDKAIPILRWLKEHGCPWTAQAYHVAARHGAVENSRYSGGCTPTAACGTRARAAQLAAIPRTGTRR